MTASAPRREPVRAPRGEEDRANADRAGTLHVVDAVVADHHRVVWGATSSRLSAARNGSRAGLPPGACSSA